MKVKDLINQLSNHNPEDEVFIEVNHSMAGLNMAGGTAGMEIKNVFTGFDWDMGKCFLQPKHDLVPFNISDWGGGGAGHDCKGCCVCCSTHHALEILAGYALEGRFGTKHDKNGGYIMPWKDIKITPQPSRLKRIKK